MHRGIREFVEWLEAHREDASVKLSAPAAANDILAIEQEIGAPLPFDLRFVLGRFNGAELPTCQLLQAATGPGPTIGQALKDMAERADRSFLDPELLLPFCKTAQESYLCFDRSAAPVSDTWPIVDFDLESGEARLVHRTLDGWCQVCLGEWTSPEFTKPFDLDRYLKQGERHARIEPDVSVAHVTVGHALRRTGQPEEALEAYLRGGRCVPAITWADWEALKLAFVLDKDGALLEAATRLAKRAPRSTWEIRGTTPSRVAFVLARRFRALRPEDVGAWTRLIDRLEMQAIDDEDRAAIQAILRALNEDEPLPLPVPPQPLALAPVEPVSAWWERMRDAYAAGALRDDDLALEPIYARVRSQFAWADVLRLRREF